MKGIVPVLEHMILTASMFAIFILAYTSFYKINDEFLEMEKENSLSLMAEKTARGVIMAYETGKNSDPENDPVSKITLDIPSDLAGYPYKIYYRDGRIRAMSKGISVEAEIFSLQNRVDIQGEIYSTSSKRPQVKYYRESNVIILGYEN